MSSEAKLVDWAWIRRDAEATVAAFEGEHSDFVISLHAQAVLALFTLVGEMADHLEAVLKLSPDCKRCAYLIARAKETRGD